MALSTDNEDLTVGLTASDLKVKLYDGSEVTLQKFTAEPIDGVKPNSVLCRRPDHEACMVGKSWTKDSMKLRESVCDAVTKAMAAGAGKGAAKGQPKASTTGAAAVRNKAPTTGAVNPAHAHILKSFMNYFPSARQYAWHVQWWHCTR